MGNGAQTGWIRPTKFMGCKAVGNQRTSFFIDGSGRAVIQHTKMFACEALGNGVVEQQCEAALRTMLTWQPIEVESL